jgi:hypothetical protein
MIARQKSGKHCTGWLAPTAESSMLTRGVYTCTSFQSAGKTEKRREKDEAMSIKHLYKQVKSGMWEVGYYDPYGYWQPESEHDNANAASQRVHYLNAGASLLIYYAYLQIEQSVASGLLRSAGAMAERERSG